MKPKRYPCAISGNLVSLWMGVAAAAVAATATATPPDRMSPAVFASPIHAGCKVAGPSTCQIIVEPFTIDLAAGKTLVFFQVDVDGVTVYDFRPDQSNPPLGPYTPSQVKLGFAVTCGKAHTVQLIGRDSGDSSPFILGSTLPISCPAAPGTRFYPLSPCRLLDTRNSSGPDAGAPILAASETRSVAVAGKCSIPSSAASLSVNTTVTGETVQGNLLLFRGDISPGPLASSIDFSAGKTRANNGILDLASDGSGTFRVFNHSTGTVHFILDVNGYFR